MERVWQRQYPPTRFWGILGIETDADDETRQGNPWRMGYDGSDIIVTEIV